MRKPCYQCSSLFPAVCRHVHQTEPDERVRRGGSAVQDVRAARSAQPALQGDVHAAGGAVPAGGGHPHGLRLQQEKHEEEGDGWMVRHG